MAKQNVKNEGDERLESIETTLTRAEQFVIDNQKAIIVVLAIMVVAVLAFFGVKKYYLEPREKDAQAAIYHAEQYFENDNFTTALNILIELAVSSQKKGAFSLKDAYMIYHAIDGIESELQNEVNRMNGVPVEPKKEHVLDYDEKQDVENTENVIIIPPKKLKKRN
jgi:hypothetical protein